MYNQMNTEDLHKLYIPCQKERYFKDFIVFLYCIQNMAFCKTKLLVVIFSNEWHLSRKNNVGIH